MSRKVTVSKASAGDSRSPVEGEELPEGFRRKIFDSDRLDWLIDTGSYGLICDIQHLADTKEGLRSLVRENIDRLMLEDS